jgi:hypothetical protein
MAMNLTKRFIGIIGLSTMVCLALFSSSPRALSFETNEGQLVYDDGKIKILAIPMPVEDVESYESIEPQAAAKPKTKILAAYTGDDPVDPFSYEAFFDTGEDVVHLGSLEIRRASDMCKFIYSIQGPESVVEKTGWVGPFDPGLMYISWFVDTYSTAGFYTLKVTVKPQKNKVGGKSSDTCRFRVLLP